MPWGIGPMPSPFLFFAGAPCLWELSYQPSHILTMPCSHSILKPMPMKRAITSLSAIPSWKRARKRILWICCDAARWTDSFLPPIRFRWTSFYLPAPFPWCAWIEKLLRICLLWLPIIIRALFWPLSILLITIVKSFSTLRAARDLTCCRI